MNDPTYIKSEIDADPDWALAFRLSELDNDNAPIGWSHYIADAKLIRARYTDQEIANGRVPLMELWRDVKPERRL